MVGKDAGVDEARGVEAVKEGPFGDVALREGIVGQVEAREVPQGRREAPHRNFAGETIEAKVERLDLRAVEDLTRKAPLQRIAGEIDGEDGEGAEFPEEGEREVERCDLRVAAEVDLGEGVDTVGVVGDVA